MLAGLEPVSSGEIRIDGADVSHRPPKDRDIAMVFQNSALYPRMTVAENMGYALRLRGIPKRERAARVVRCDGRAAPRIGDRVGVVVQASDAHLFNRRTGQRLN
jgi:ABC-type Fe3+/spermidine/putrescine transport system ATPase subunit